MDKKTVISWLEGIADVDWRDYHSDSEVSNIAKSALKLIDDQDLHLQHLLEIAEEFEKELNKQPEIVRCKNCRHMFPAGYCHKNARKIPNNDYNNWFCADGERKENV